MCKGVHLPTPLEEDHFALTPLVEMGVPPPLTEHRQICLLLMEQNGA